MSSTSTACSPTRRRSHLRSYQDILSPHGITLTEADYCARYLGFDDEGAFRQIAADYGLLFGDEEIEVLHAGEDAPVPGAGLQR